MRDDHLGVVKQACPIPTESMSENDHGAILRWYEPPFKRDTVSGLKGDGPIIVESDRSGCRQNRASFWVEKRLSVKLGHDYQDDKSGRYQNKGGEYGQPDPILARESSGRFSRV